MEDIRAAGAEPYVTRLLFSLLRRLLETYRRARLVTNLPFSSTIFLYVIAYTAGLPGGAYLYFKHQITMATASLFVYYIVMLPTPLQTIKEQVEDLQQASASIERVEELFHIQSRLQDQGHTTLPSNALGVAFRSVTFSYDGQQNVLQDISFQLQPGKVLGLLGRTGSGKTTIARLLFRLHHPATGGIYLDGKELRAVALEDFRSHVGMVTQDLQLFHASIRDNLTFFNRRISDARIEQALKELDLWQWLQSLPQGLDTRLGAGGQGLSPGEARMLALARGVFTQPRLVILNEASSRPCPLTKRPLGRAGDTFLSGVPATFIA